MYISTTASRNSLALMMRQPHAVVYRNLNHHVCSSQSVNETIEKGDIHNLSYETVLLLIEDTGVYVIYIVADHHHVNALLQYWQMCCLQDIKSLCYYQMKQQLDY